jgi:hypothetical protein
MADLAGTEGAARASNEIVTRDAARFIEREKSVRCCA